MLTSLSQIFPFQIILFLFGVIIVALVYKDRILVVLYAYPTIRKFFPVDPDDEDKQVSTF
jgi:hypothetical protein